MEFIIAKNAGFCFGVKRAVDATYKALSEVKGKIYSIGPLIHNEVVTKDLASKGLIEVNDLDEIKGLKNEVVIIRTHGVEQRVYEILKNNGNKIIDLTCPFVSKIHSLVKQYSEEGYKIIVIGDKDHPEVKGIVSFSSNEIFVVICKEDIEKLPINKEDKVLIVFQTTTNVANAEKLVDILKDLFYNYSLVNTICNATENRQNEVVLLAKSCDAMLIIGSKTSSNTKKLYDISKKYCANTNLISDINDTKDLKLDKNIKVGVSAGASTPEYLIEEILNNVRNEF